VPSPPLSETEVVDSKRGAKPGESHPGGRPRRFEISLIERAARIHDPDAGMTWVRTGETLGVLPEALPTLKRRVQEFRAGRITHVGDENVRSCVQPPSKGLGLQATEQGWEGSIVEYLSSELAPRLSNYQNRLYRLARPPECNRDANDLYVDLLILKGSIRDFQRMAGDFELKIRRSNRTL